MIFKRRLVVDTKYQFRQAALIITANVLVLLLVAALLSWFYLLVWDGRVAYHHNPRVAAYLWCCLAVVVMGTTLVSLRRSRMTAGMMRKMHGVLENAGQGDLPDREVQFRKKDYCREIALPLNDCLDQMRRYQATVKELEAGFDSLLGMLERKEIEQDEVSQCVQTMADLLKEGGKSSETL